jgi:hypothetical protein
MLRFFAISIAAASLAAASDSGGVAGPLAGFVFDRGAGVIRRIEGLPGAARIGAPVTIPFAVSLVAAAGRRDYALAVPASGGALALVRGLRAESPELVEIPAAIEPSAIAIAASGDAAILYSAAARRLQFVEGLPTAPRALDSIDLAAIDSASAIAVDAAGRSALIASGDGQIYRVRRDSGPVPIARLAGASSLSFLPGRDAALAASAETGDVLLLDGLDGSLSIRSIGGVSARAVQALDNRTAAVISGDGQLASIDLEAGSVEWIPLAAAAESFDPIDRSLFVLNRAGDGPLVLFDAANGRSAWFVPPVRPALRPRGHGKDLVSGEDRPH